ncbi:hypothetical protein PIROE2DRAFT_59276 [Piromyces sp. E2]|nr:hypothetical protein PIROE2DRAFT_59276 [Piromyces sp. E2]|eukprot:OUM66536.1 hypothetical protein PIROE2DRAFT_59276 [Piromyces sp. E2]
MKIIKLLLTLLLSVTVTLATHQDENEEEVIRTLKQCEKDIEINKNCIYGIVYFTKENIEEICTEYNGEKCQTFIKDPMAALPACQSLPEELRSTYEQLFIISKPSMAFFCQKDENNELCPLVEHELSGNKKEKYDMDVMKAVKKTCLSKQCKAVALNLYRVLNDSINDEEAILNEDQEVMKNNNIIRKIYQTLKSDNCTESKNMNSENIKEYL